MNRPAEIALRRREPCWSSRGCQDLNTSSCAQICLVQNWGIVEGLSVEPPDRGGRGRGQPAASHSPRVRSQARRHQDKVIQAYVRGLTRRPGPRRGGRAVEPEAGHKIA